MLATNSGNFKTQDGPSKRVTGLSQTSVIRPGPSSLRDMEPVLSEP